MRHLFIVACIIFVSVIIMRANHDQYIARCYANENQNINLCLQANGGADLFDGGQYRRLEWHQDEQGIVLFDDAQAFAAMPMDRDGNLMRAEGPLYRQD